MSRIPYRTLSEALVAAPLDKPFVTMWAGDRDIRTVTFGEFLNLSKVYANNFQTQGIDPGDRMTLIMPQGIELMAAFAGAMLLGAVPAILAYPNLKVEPNKYRQGLKGVTSNLKAKALVIDNAFPKELLSQVALGEGSVVLQLSGPSSTPPSIDLGDSIISQDQLALIQHSAGTTGLQKGVALSHQAVLAQLRHLGEALELTDHDSIYSWLPLYHDMGLIACFMLPMVYHLPIVMQSPIEWVMEPISMLELLTEYKSTLAWVPNFTLQFLVRHAQRAGGATFDLSSLRALINCSEPVRAASCDEFLRTFAPYGLRPEALQSSYALAENVFAVTQSDLRCTPQRIQFSTKALREGNGVIGAAAPNEKRTWLVSSGRCLSNNQVRIVSSEGQELPDGQVGEILIRSDSLFGGYYNRPDLTAVALKDGWYSSGDLGLKLDNEIYVTGRKRDLIIVAGKNIYPQDIEEIVFAHASIHDGRAVAFGLFNRDLGTEEIVIVAEVEKEHYLSESVAIQSAIRKAILAELGVTVGAIHLKSPKWIVKSTAGKPARGASRDKLLAELGFIP